MFEFLSNPDFWRMMIAIQLEIWLFYLIIRERERLEFESHRVEIETKLKAEIEEIINKSKKDLEELMNEQSISRR